MYKVLIVDDELLVRNYLCSLVDWEQLGFYICGEAGNGQEAMKQIEQLAPDLIFLDINMPVMDGVVLSERISKHYPQLLMFVLSSFDDYPFVRETLKNGAMDYLLKDTLDKPYLCKMLEQARSRLEMESRQRTERQSERLRVERLQEIASDKIIREILIGTEPYDEKLVQGIGMPLMEICNGGFVVAVMQISRYSTEHGGRSDAGKEQFVRSIQLLCKQAWDSTEDTLTFIMSFIEEDRFGFIFPFHGTKSEAGLQRSLSEQTRKISYMLNHYLNAQVVWGISRRYYRAEYLNRCYREALDATSLNWAEPQNKVKTLSIRQELDMLMALESRDFRRVEIVIEDVFASSEKVVDPVSLQLLVNDLMMIMVKVSSENKLDIQKMYEPQILAPIRPQVGENLSAAKQSVLFIFKTIIEELVQRSLPEGYSEHCKKAIKYIQLNYNKELSLSDLSDMLGISPAYFSRVFRKETGFGFVEYLNKLRIDKAKQRMKDGDHHVKKISKEVGINSYSHFFKLFKELTGLTPAGYLDECVAGGNRE